MIVYYFEDASSLSSSLVVGIRFLHLKTFFFLRLQLVQSLQQETVIYKSSVETWYWF